jgi:hypothetical protein
MVFPLAGCRYPASSGGMVGGYAIAEVSLSRGADGSKGVWKTVVERRKR